jgi:hypothetical protein
LPWSDAEDALLHEKVAEYGPKWAKISVFFKGRSDASIKNRWSSLNGRAGSAAADSLPQMPHLFPLQQPPAMIPWAMHLQYPHCAPRPAPECRRRARPRVRKTALPRPPSPPPFEIGDLLWIPEEGINDPRFELVPKAERPDLSFPTYGGSIWW